MIQRIQSIFLLLAAGASFSLFGLNFASTPEAIASSSLFTDRVFNIFDNPALIALFSIGGALALISVFLYKNRNLQMRLTIFAFIATLIGIVMAMIFFMQNSNDVGQAPISDEIGVYIPALALVFTLLAYRFIGKDDKLVKSMDRLR